MYLYIIFSFLLMDFSWIRGLKEPILKPSSGHGTGTALGDPIEVGAIKAALG